jgi:hypothetical protein
MVQLVGCRKLMLTAALVFCLVATCAGRVESVVIRAADRIAGVLTLEF